MNKSLTISRVIELLEKMKEEAGDLEVFVTNGEDAVFYGAKALGVIVDISKNKQYLAVFGTGDILKI